MRSDWKTYAIVHRRPDPEDMHGTATDLEKGLSELRLHLLELAHQTRMGQAVYTVDGWNELLAGILA